ncbi:hypothetical protein BKA63DRAFT_526594 [Paraphoma chrysanthemicola]|nr:hypothetical protein BKA63DRAFT_526594 [Paraphoma chrysanthemicola]
MLIMQLTISFQLHHPLAISAKTTLLCISKSAMFPGRYPSPTPSRESTPIDSIEISPALDGVRATTPDRSPFYNFTAPDFMRQRPRFAASQSEPSLPLENENDVLSPSPSLRSRASTAKGRRVSEPHRTPLRKQRDGREIRKQNVSRRVVTDPVKSTFVHGIADFNPYFADQPNEATTSTSSAASTPASNTTFVPTAHSRSSCSSTPPSSRGSSPASTSTSPSSGPSSSPSSTHPKFLTSPHAINDKIYTRVRKNLTLQDCAGVIYIIFDASRPDRGYKIGITTKKPYTTRLKEHLRDCGIDPAVVSVTDEISYCKRTERLIHLDLEDRLQYFECKGHKQKGDTCKVTEHKEWFKTTAKEAKQTVEKWVTFMETERPYNMGRQLSPFWHHTLTHRYIRQPDTDSEANHNTRREQWSKVLSRPTRMEKLDYNLRTLSQYRQFSTTAICRFWSSCVQVFWQTMALIAWFIVLITLQNTFAATAFAFVLVCAWFSIVPDGLPDGLPNKRKGKK